MNLSKWKGSRDKLRSYICWLSNQFLITLEASFLIYFCRKPCAFSVVITRFWLSFNMFFPVVLFLDFVSLRVVFLKRKKNSISLHPRSLGPILKIGMSLTFKIKTNSWGMVLRNRGQLEDFYFWPYSPAINHIPLYCSKRYIYEHLAFLSL